ncbi:MAG TPA: gamma-glutamyltransferase [Ignavibacteria bacterium]|nr:gamma-glutamyltransferase [Ignavibacteria bacterium]HMR39780.1 gamma-glutamyltransferase [Ignavibacteria bacterium]
MMKFLKTTLLLFFISNISFGQELSYRNGVVSSAQEIASKVGIEILKSGGNAIDAAVGVGFALAVVYPQAGNIGGGGFMMIHYNDKTGKPVNTSIDYREKAPLQSDRDMYLNSSGEIVAGLSTLGNLAAGVPGSVAGMLYALEKYGTMDRASVIDYAINIADTGFMINEGFAELLNNYQKDFSLFPSTMKVFGGNFKSGDVIIQKDLANTLRIIRDNGADGFYKGEVAQEIVSSMEKSNGIITFEDLVLYQPKERDVIEGYYRGYEILSMGPPSSGGISLIYLLNILENYDLGKNGYGNVQNIQLMTEAMRRVYADRSEFMGDADFVNVPVSVLTSNSYALERMDDYSPIRASISNNIKPGDAVRKESSQTTHYSIADKDGNLVSVTTTINDVFGNKVVVDGAGFFLNNEMDDFVSKPGVPNLYGLLGSEANSIAPQKRMLSSMTPTIVLKDNKPFLVVGSPGGGRIITSVLQTIVNIIDYDLDLDKAINNPRFHHQWFPDEIQVENNFLNEGSEKALKDMGYTIKPIRDFGSINAILFLENGEMTGGSDRRGYGSAIGF